MTFQYPFNEERFGVEGVDTYLPKPCLLPPEKVSKLRFLTRHPLGNQCTGPILVEKSVGKGGIRGCKKRDGTRK